MIEFIIGFVSGLIAFGAAMLLLSRMMRPKWGAL